MHRRAAAVIFESVRESIEGQPDENQRLVCTQTGSFQPPRVRARYAGNGPGSFPLIRFNHQFPRAATAFMVRFGARDQTLCA